MSKSLALLVCDTPAAILSTHGDYEAVFSTHLRSSLPAGADFTLDAYDVVHKKEYPPEDKEYDGIVITGSAASAYENVEWINKLVAYVASVANDKPYMKIIGICFGHQIVARALGGECVPNDGKWEVGVTEIDLTDLGKEIFGVDALNIQEMHRDHVPGIPPTFLLLGSTPVTYNQGMVRFSPSHEPSSAPLQLTDVHIFTVQGHPEFTESIVSAIMDARLATGALSVPIVEDAKRRAGWRNDGVSVIGKAIWGVLGVS